MQTYTVNVVNLRAMKTMYCVRNKGLTPRRNDNEFASAIINFKIESHLNLNSIIRIKYLFLCLLDSTSVPKKGYLLKSITSGACSNLNALAPRLTHECIKAWFSYIVIHRRSIVGDH